MAQWTMPEHSRRRSTGPRLTQLSLVAHVHSAASDIDSAVVAVTLAFIIAVVFFDVDAIGEGEILKGYAVGCCIVISSVCGASSGWPRKKRRIDCQLLVFFVLIAALNPDERIAALG